MLSLAVLITLEELLDVSVLTNLERLVLAVMLLMVSLPDMSTIANLKTFIVSIRNPLCCNGFLNTKCDLGNDFCLPIMISRPATCLMATGQRSTIATLALFTKYLAFACSPPIGISPPSDSASDLSIKKYNGTLYTSARRLGTPWACATRRASSPCSASRDHSSWKRGSDRSSGASGSRAIH